MYITDHHNQQQHVVNVTNFTDMFIVNNLRPYTEYSVYVTAVKLINVTGRLLEGEKSETVNERTLAGGILLYKPYRCHFASLCLHQHGTPGSSESTSYILLGSSRSDLLKNYLGIGSRVMPNLLLLKLFIFCLNKATRRATLLFGMNINPCIYSHAH